MTEVRWEYKVITPNLIKNVSHTESLLNAVGQYGWEVCGVCQNGILLKRPGDWGICTGGKHDEDPD